eukprot:gene92-biopygen59
MEAFDAEEARAAQELERRKVLLAEERQRAELERELLVEQEELIRDELDDRSVIREEERDQTADPPDSVSGGAAEDGGGPCVPQHSRY